MSQRTDPKNEKTMLRGKWRPIPTISAVFDDGAILEMLYQPADRRSAFVVNICMRNTLSKRDIAFYRAYLEILNERVPLVDHWDSGTTSWHPRVVQKLLWYSGLRPTIRNRALAYDWLVKNATQPLGCRY